MKSPAAIVRSIPGRYEIVEVDLDPPQTGEVLVRFVASGLCHSDLHVLTGHQPGPAPFCAGHEGAGIVEEVGPGVKNLRPGDHVVASFVPACGHCRYCASGRMNLCQLGRYLQVGPMPDGTYRMHFEGQDLHQFLLISTFSKYSTVMEDSLVKVPDDLPLESLCLLGCGVGTGLGSATNVAQVRPGDHVVVVGCGGVGMSAVQGASLAGAASVIAVDPVPFKLETALLLGATHAFDSIKDATNFVRSVTDGQGADAAILAMDAPTNKDVADGFAAIAKGGTVVLTAMAAITEPVGIPVHLLELAGMQKSIRGNVFGMCNPPSDILRQIDLYRAGKLKLDEMITRTYPLSQINDAVDDLEAGRLIRGVILHDA